MAWLSRVNFTASDVLSYTDLNNLGNDIRAWGGNVNGGGYTLSNVILSATSGTMATVIGGTGTTSTLTLRSTSGVGTTGADIILQTGNNGATEVMRIQNGGNVGIGTSSPGHKLELGGGGGIVSSYLYSPNNDSLELLAGTSFSSSGAAISLRPSTGGYNDHGMEFYTGGGEKMRIDSSGNVGIGTSSPSTYGLLTVSGGSTTISPVLTIESTAFNSGQSCALAFARNGFTQPIQARIRTADNGASASNLIFETKADGTAGALSERMRIDSSGNVKVGGTTDRATTAGTNQVVIFNGTAPVGTLANGCSFYSTAGEMRVMDAAGNATLLSPHDSVTNEWIYDSSHTLSGKRLKINVERLLRFINDHFGLDCVHDLMEEA